MNSFETIATVEEQGEVRIAGVPFAPGTEVEVTINPKRQLPDEFAAAWERLCRHLRGRNEIQDISDDTIREEIEHYRAKR